jgi:hypothetical protein
MIQSAVSVALGILGALGVVVAVLVFLWRRL